MTAGQRFGRLIVVERGENSKAGKARWRCRCDCGGEAIVLGADLRNGHSRSCGCLAREKSAARALLRNRKGTPAERFAAFVGEPDENGCIPWLGGKHHGGYGQLSLSRRASVAAHRFAYELAHGPIPEGLHVHHLCENRSCVNVAHLRLLTPEGHVLLHRPFDKRPRAA